MDRVIYIPQGYEPGMERGYPLLLYFIRNLNDREMLASIHLEDAEKGKGQLLPRKRSLLFTDELWSICKTHIDKRNELEEEWLSLLKKLNKEYKNAITRS